ncbi:MAG: hypothetical protein NTZ18_01090 [Candidatus Komeilibacteria bacterium]|nr:hypothetical protein [Candidatus Komeilibacteria bacterium]
MDSAKQDGKNSIWTVIITIVVFMAVIIFAPSIFSLISGQPAP